MQCLQAESDVAAEHAMTLYRDVIRRLLRTTQGYECQEAEGNFMLAFHKPITAVQFCLLVMGSTASPPPPNQHPPTPSHPSTHPFCLNIASKCCFGGTCTYVHPFTYV